MNSNCIGFGRQHSYTGGKLRADDQNQGQGRCVAPQRGLGALLQESVKLQCYLTASLVIYMMRQKSILMNVTEETVRRCCESATRKEIYKTTWKEYLRN